MNASAIETLVQEGALRLRILPGAAGSWTQFLDQFDEQLELAELDSRVGCVLVELTGAARLDAPREGHLLARTSELSLRFERSARAARRLPQPVILMLEGNLEGTALGLLALPDLTVASAAVVLRPGELEQAMAGIASLLARAGSPGRRALMPLITGRDLDAHAARECGLITDVVPAERMPVVIASLLEGIARGGPTAMALLKRAAFPGLSPDEIG